MVLLERIPINEPSNLLVFSGARVLLNNILQIWHCSRGGVWPAEVSAERNVKSESGYIVVVYQCHTVSYGKPDSNNEVV